MITGVEFEAMRPLLPILGGLLLVLASASGTELALATPPPPLGLPEPAPTPDPQAALDVELFEAIADGPVERLRLALNAGANPEAELPATPAGDAFRARYPSGPLYFYLRREPGYTALMYAAAIGNEPAVRYLLAAGAEPNRLSRRSKTFALWQAARNGHLAIMRRLMALGPDADRYRVTVDLALQQATVWDRDLPVLRTPISSGKSSSPTKPGRYLVTNKYKQWKSTIYDAKMPFFLRLSCGDFGLHAGHLPGYPASHGCVRLPEANARQLFALLPVGTLVEIR